jgi:hypothetical protein
VGGALVAEQSTRGAGGSVMTQSIEEVCQIVGTYEGKRWDADDNRWETAKEIIGDRRVTLGPQASPVAQIREERLADYERRLGTGHTVVDARHMIREIRHLRAFMQGLADSIENEGCSLADVAESLRFNSKAIGE